MSAKGDAYRRDGFCVARGLIPRSDVAAVLHSIQRTIDQQLQHLGTTPHGDLHASLRTLHRLDLDRYKRTLAALWRKADVSGLMRHPALFRYLGEQFGWRDVFLPGGEVALLMAGDLKIPGGYFGLSAHQDFPSVQGSLDGVVAWIPLTDVDRDGWTIEVVPGRHRHGLVADAERTSNGWELQPDHVGSAEWCPIEARAGDVVFMSVFTIHRSMRAGDPRRMRIALSTRFDNAEEPSFVARAYPTAYQRSVHRELFVEAFPSAEQVAAVFD